MSHVVALPGVERFNLSGQQTSPSLTAAGMARIGQLPRLQRILVQGMTDPSGFLPYLFDKPRLRSIWLQAAAVTDGDLARLARLTRLEELLLNGRNVTDAGFAHLANLKSLRWLDLPGCHVGDLSALSGLKDLERIYLHTNTRVSPRHDQSTPVYLGPLHNLSKLTTLSLSPIPVDDAGLARIKDLPQLQCLDVAGLGITEAGLAHIDCEHAAVLVDWPLEHFDPGSRHALPPPPPPDVAIERLLARRIADHRRRRPARQQGSTSALRRLSLRQTKVTDGGLKHLAGLNGLTFLDLSATRVGDTGMRELAGLSSLQILDLRGTLVSKASAASLQTRLPGLRILR